MNQITAKLSQLRRFFIIYFSAQLIVDIIIGWDLIQVGLGSWRGYGLGRLQVSRGAFLPLILFVAGVQFALGMWLFRRLLQHKQWARVILLVIGWLTVADALLSFLFTSGTRGLVPWLNNLVPDLDWQRALLVDRIKDFLGFLFWGYLIYILQFNAKVKRDFLQPPQPTSTEKEGQPEPKTDLED